jgi:hypothetical protein
VHVVAIRTPSDFRSTLDADGSSVTICIQPAPHIEPEIRRHIDEIFDDRSYISGNDPPDMISTYLDGIAEPLAWLEDVGLRVTAIMREREGNQLGIAAYYVHTPESAYSVKGAEPGAVQVHVFGPACAGAQALGRADQAAFTLWPSRAAVEQAFEGRVPWCDDCFMATLGS